MKNEEAGFSLRLDQIETQWSLLLQAHEMASADALNTLVLRYSPVIRGYIRNLTRNDADADELAQEAVIRILKGDFSGADPKRGRFRDLLMVAVKNMVRNHWGRLNRSPRTGVELPESAESDEDSGGLDATADELWLSQWRAHLIEIGMSRLERYQQESPGNAAYTALQLRSSFPELDSNALAEKLSAITGREINAAAYRQILKRGRVRFAEYIVEEVAHGLEQADVGRVQEELIDVGLYEYIRDVLPEAWNARSQPNT